MITKLILILTLYVLYLVLRPSEVVQSTTEHTEEDVTDQMVRGGSSPANQFEENPLNFPGLRSDLDDIERHFFSGMKSFFDAAEEMKSSLFDIMGDYDSNNTVRGIPPIQDHPKIDDENAATRQPFSSGEIDLSGLAKDVWEYVFFFFLFFLWHNNNFQICNVIPL